ncbi:unnamed protein product [Rotaria socialis]|uniref:RING-type domain-containing protein n=1 Tax=Rotaria socialis TaxID=392032 RepID=A0A820WUP1_9BILA|nr:unnamed protein product [Rotaria socialis]CAF3478959.1 unnamed protein product [Rotaria socialis]CAF3502001.1 unnamed protein product [Rotaria socialis]CAF3529469.1 unnamed protein product [Rotaria socialis]CAF3587608.1 unnamed protein product [Rotaria socialis]
MATKGRGGSDNVNYSSALMSSAIQDHRARTLDLSMPGRLSNKNIIRPRPIPRNQIKSVIDTGLKKKSETNSSASTQTLPITKPDGEREYVIQDSQTIIPHRQRGTLAERIGLIQVKNNDAENHLTEAAWGEIKQRSNDREDSNCPCAICQEDFGLGPQVLLSCSHVFHRACLTTFERFVSYKANGSDQRTCPICRRAQYEKRIIYEGAKIHRAKCAARIQAAWRGYIVRQWYKSFRLDMSNIPNDTKLRRRFYQDKLSEITDRIVASCDFDLNELFNEIDRNVERARAIRQAFDARIRTIDEDEWQQIQERAKLRHELECSICKCLLQPINIEAVFKNIKKPIKTNKNKLEKLFPQLKPIEQKPTAIKQAELQQPKRPLILLSCTHVFHATCLQMFEEYCCDPTPNCPVCRTAYQKNTFSF